MRTLRALYRRWRVRRAVAGLAGTHVLNELARVRPDTVFVQVGANDGRMMDPLRKTVTASRWRGLAVEPVPAFYRRLERNYRSLADRVRPVNAAVAARSGEAAFYHLRDLPDADPLPAWAAGLGSFSKDVILAHGDRIPGIERHLVEIRVPCLSWAELCATHGIERVDLVLTDTEGYDYEIVRQLDFDRYRPVVLIYEHHHFDAATDAACTGLLKSHGYGLFREGLDTWAIDGERADRRYARLLTRWPAWVAASPHASVI